MHKAVLLSANAVLCFETKGTNSVKLRGNFSFTNLKQTHTHKNQLLQIQIQCYSI